MYSVWFIELGKELRLGEEFPVGPSIEGLQCDASDCVRLEATQLVQLASKYPACASDTPPMSTNTRPDMPDRPSLGHVE